MAKSFLFFFCEFDKHIVVSNTYTNIITFWQMAKFL